MAKMDSCAGEPASSCTGQRTASRYPVFRNDTEWSPQCIMSDVTAEMEPPGKRTARARAKMLRMMPWATTATQHSHSSPTPSVSSVSTKPPTLRAMAALVSAPDMDTSSWPSILEPNFFPSQGPKSRSRSSDTLTTSKSGTPSALHTSSAVFAARCRSDEKTCVIRGSREARCAASRRAWTTPWAVRGESREPAMWEGSEGLTGREHEDYQVRTRGQTRCRQTRHGGSSIDAC
jgi:hypothetical protein